MSPRATTALSVLGAVAFAALLLARPIAAFGGVVWGPELPWLHRDFLGAFWLFWASAQPGDPLALLSWPDGALPLQTAIPNPFDAWVLGPLVAHLPFPAWWNGMQLAHHLLNVAAVAWLARASGARGLPAFVGAALVAASPVMLHEIAGGRTLSGAVWPGLVALGLLQRGRPLLAGIGLAVQGLAYIYAGLLFGLAALVLRPRLTLSRAAPLALLLIAPYLAWLGPLLSGLHHAAPPAGFTALPLAGLLGLSSVPERFQLAPVLLLGLLAHRQRRWLAVALLALLFALGPHIEWTRGAPVATGPLAWLQWAALPLARMHHPVRAALLLAPALAVLLSLVLSARSAWLSPAALLLALPWALRAQTAAAWEASPVPPGVEAARWLAGHAGAVVDLTGEGGAALGLQPVHGLPMLEGLRVEHAASGRTCGSLQDAVNHWLAAEPQPALPARLRAAGFTHVLVLPRTGPVDTAALEADLGPPVFPGVYAL